MPIRIPPHTMSQSIDRLAVSKKEAAAMLGVCERSLNNWVKQGKIVAKKAGTRLLFPVKSLHDFLDGADHRNKR